MMIEKEELVMKYAIVRAWIAFTAAFAGLIVLLVILIAQWY